MKIFVRTLDPRWRRIMGLSRVSVLLNTADAAPFIGKAVEGAILGSYTFDQVQEGEVRPRQDQGRPRRR